MDISVFGSGYVGLVQAAVMADVGHKVTCMDVNKDRVRALKAGDLPFYEPGLRHMLREGIDNKLLGFTDSAGVAVRAGTYLFIAVGTPANSQGAADLQHVLGVARSIGLEMTERKVIIIKSTVPVGTADKVRAAIAEALAERGEDIPFDVVSNPEFLKEGSAVADATRPDRIIIGAESAQVVDEMRIMYQAYNRNHDKLMTMDPRSAEMTKYAANAMLATKISFINEMANIAEAVGADIEEVRRGIGADPRIGYQFIYPGAGYGGSCFPKDIRALKSLAKDHGQNAPIITAVHDTNQRQKNKLGERVLNCLGADLSRYRIAVWGLSFKPNTDDLREAPSAYLLDVLWSQGATVQAYDPEAMENARAQYGVRDDLILCDTKEEALKRAECLVICTEWKAFFSPNFEQVTKLMKRPLIIDGRNLYDPNYVAGFGIEYYAIGRGLSIQHQDG
ncbi:MAG: UDP-glucose/GDP-mannose dehydrogenase family protein [Pseudomonadota bacterium]